MCCCCMAMIRQHVAVTLLTHTDFNPQWPDNVAVIGVVVKSWPQFPRPDFFRNVPAGKRCCGVDQFTADCSSVVLTKKRSKFGWLEFRRFWPFLRRPINGGNLGIGPN